MNLFFLLELLIVQFVLFLIHGFAGEVEVSVTVLTYDEIHNPEIPGLLATSVALGISDTPSGMDQWRGLNM